MNMDDQELEVSNGHDVQFPSPPQPGSNCFAFNEQRTRVANRSTVIKVGSPGNIDGQYPRVTWCGRILWLLERH